MLSVEPPDEKTCPPVLRVRLVSAAVGLPLPSAIASIVTPARFAVSIAAASLVFVVSSPSVSTTSTFVSVGALPSSLLAWITES